MTSSVKRVLGRGNWFPSRALRHRRHKSVTTATYFRHARGLLYVQAIDEAPTDDRPDATPRGDGTKRLLRAFSLASRTHRAARLSQTATRQAPAPPAMARRASSSPFP